MLEEKGYEVFTRPFELNIVGLRSKSSEYQDEFHVFYKTNDKHWNYHLYMGTCGKEMTGQYKDEYHIAKLGDKGSMAHKYMEKGFFASFRDPRAMQELLELCEKHRQLYGNSFTYTVMDFKGSGKSTINKIAKTISDIANIVIELTK